MIGLGSKAALGIGIQVYLDDRFSAQAKVLNANLQQMHDNSLKFVDAAGRASIASSTRIAAAAGLISAGLWSAGKAGASFQHDINQIFIVGEGQIGKTRKQLTEMANTMSTAFGEGPQKVAQAMLDNIKAGYTTGLEEITKYQLAVAKASGEAVEGQQGVAAGILTTLNMMGIQAEQMYNVAGKSVSGISRVGNAVLTAANKSRASVYSINEAMQYFGPTAHAMKFDLETTLGLIAKVQNAGLGGSASGTALANMLTALTKNTGPFAGPNKAKAFATMGIDPNWVVKMGNQGPEGLIKAMDTIQVAMNRLPIMTRKEVADQIFNTRGERAAFTAFTKGDVSLGQMIGQIRGGVKSDVAMTQSKDMMNDLDGEYKRLAASTEQLRNKFVEVAGPTMRGILKFGISIMNFTNKFLGTGMGRVLAKIVVIGTPLVAILFSLRAAAMAAAFALRGFSASASTGGYMSTLRGVLGGGGLSNQSTLAASLRGNVRQNSAGRWIVKGGQTVTTASGAVLKGGQFLPTGSAAMAGMMGASWMSGGAAAAAGGSMMSKAAGFLGTIAGFAGKIIPIVGAIFLIKDILGAILGATEENNQKKNEMLGDYQRTLYENVVGPGSAPWRGTPTSASGGMINNNITVNVDGTKATQQVINKNFGDDVDSSMDYNMNSY